MNAVMQTFETAVLPMAVFAPMGLSELEAVLRIEQQACRFPWSRGNFADAMASAYTCRVYRSGEAILGYFILMPVVDEAHLLNIAVAPAYQGKKLGARLLHQAMMMARDAGAHTLLLEVRPSNAAALALYRRAGFQQIGIRRNYYRDAVGCEDAVVMSRALGDAAEEWPTLTDLPDLSETSQNRRGVSA